ncbi:alpha/beta hydrolase [Pseudonocardia sp. KRD291]|uniref:alpha/beta hydrolase n=1 Tax=Pseudonocardia sp. KRD291 TaxID=2792007 RepID=UPI001C4A75E5|nr:hypothetical protein [Pseudonocardia sp. KRD291]MBW0105598.1 phospholipase [Pseudonocardia sp. KRD291]
MADDRRTDVGDLPVVARWGTEHPSAPLVVVLHGNGTSEHSVIEMSPWLPHGSVAYAAVRAPVELGAGYRWFLDADDGVPDRTSLDTTCAWVLRWLDGEGDPARPVLLVGFREGVTLAGAVMSAAPERLAGAALLYGALAFDDGPPTARGGLRGMPVFLGQGSEDTRTPAHLLARTREWLATGSGAPVLAVRAAGGAQLAGEVVGHLGTWLGDRLDFLRAHGENPLPDGDEPDWPTVPGGRLAARAGAPPEVGPDGPPFRLGTEEGLHLVLPDELAYDAVLKGWAAAHPLAGVRTGSGAVLVPGPRDDAETAIVDGITAAAHQHAAPGS